MDLEAQKKLVEKLNEEIRQMSIKLGRAPLKVFDVTELREAQTAVEGLRSALTNTSGTASDFFDNLRNITSELKGQVTPIGQIRKSFRGLTEDASKLRLDEQGISDLTTKELEKIQKRAQINSANLTDEIQRYKKSQDYFKIQNKINEAIKNRKTLLQSELETKKKEKEEAKKQLDDLQARHTNLSQQKQLQDKINNLTEDILEHENLINSTTQKNADLRSEVLSKLQGTTKEEQKRLDEARAILSYSEDDIKAQDTLLKLIQERLLLEQKVDRKVKGFEALRDIANFIPGLRAFAEPFDAAAKAARKVAKQNANIEVSINRMTEAQEANNSKLKENAKELRKLNKEYKTADKERRDEIEKRKDSIKQENKLIKDTNKELDKEKLKLQDLMKSPFWAGIKELGKVGFNMAAAFGMERMVTGLKKSDERIVSLSRNLNVPIEQADKINQRFVKFARTTGYTTDQLMKYQHALSSTLGITVDFNEENAQAFATMTERLGLSEGEASKLEVLAASTGKSLKEQNNSLVGNVMALNDASGTAVKYQDIMKDIANASSTTVIQSSKFPGGIAKAAHEARKLGLNLQQVADAGRTLLNFESSIESELEAELLTGKQLNLERARMAALTGDTATLAVELRKNFGSYAEYSKMGVLQQEALAKSMGMSADQAGEMLMKQEAMAQLSKDYNGLRLEGLSLDEQVAKIIEAEKKETGKKIDRSQALAKLGEKELSRQEKTMTNQEKMTQSLEAIADAFAPLTKFFRGLQWIFDKITTFAGFISAALGGIVLLKFANIIGLKSVFQGLIGQVNTLKTGLAATNTAAATGPQLNSAGRWYDPATGRYVKAPTGAATSTATGGGAAATTAAAGAASTGGTSKKTSTAKPKATPPKASTPKATAPTTGKVGKVGRGGGFGGLLIGAAVGYAANELMSDDEKASSFSEKQFNTIVSLLVDISKKLSNLTISVVNTGTEDQKANTALVKSSENLKQGTAKFVNSSQKISDATEDATAAAEAYLRAAENSEESTINYKKASGEALLMANDAYMEYSKIAIIGQEIERVKAGEGTQKKIVDAIKNTAKKVFGEDTIKKLSVNFNSFKESLIKTGKDFITNTKNGAKGIIESFKKGTIFSDLKSTFSNFKDTIKKQFGDFTKAFKEGNLIKSLKSSYQELKDGAKAVWETTKAAGKTLLETAREKASGLKDRVVSGAQSIAKRASEGFSSFKSSVSEKASGLKDRVVSGAKGLIERGKGLFKSQGGGSLLSKAGKLVGGGLKSAKNWAGGAISGISEGMINAVGGIKNLGKEAWAILKDPKKLLDTMKGQIKGATQGFGKNFMKLLKGMGPVSALIESIFAGFDIASLMSEGAGSKEELYQAVGKRVSESIGGVIGGLGAAALTTGLSVTGIPTWLLNGVAYTLGDKAGRWLFGSLADAVGAKGIGKLIVDTFGNDDKVQAAVASYREQNGIQGESNISSENTVNPSAPKTIEPVAMAEGGILTSPTIALAGEAGKEAVIPLTDFYKKLDELIVAVNKGGTVYLDGNKVGRALVMGSYKTD